MGQRDCDISRRERREPVHRAARGPGLQGCGHSGLLIRCWASLEPSDSRSLSLSLPCWQLITLKVASASRLSLPSPSFIQRFFPGPGAPDLSLSALQALTGPPAPQPPASRASPAASSSCLISLSASSEEAPHDSPVSPGGSRGLQEAPGVTLSHRPLSPPAAERSSQRGLPALPLRRRSSLGSSENSRPRASHTEQSYVRRRKIQYVNGV